MFLDQRENASVGFLDDSTPRHNYDIFVFFALLILPMCIKINNDRTVRFSRPKRMCTPFAERKRGGPQVKNIYSTL